MKHALMPKSNGFRGNRNRAPAVLSQGNTQSPTSWTRLARAVQGILRPDSCLSGDGFGLLPTWENRYSFVQSPKTKSFRLHGRRNSLSRPATQLWQRSVRSTLQQWPGDRLEQRIVEVNTLAPTPTKDE